MKFLYIVLFNLLIFSGCSTTEPKVTELKKRDIKALELTREINNSSLKDIFSKSQDLQEKQSKWYDRVESLELTIYVKQPEDEVSQKLYDYLKKIAQDKRELDKLGYGDISKRYKKINVVEYKYGSDINQRVDAAYSNRLFSKDKLNDILRRNNKTDYQEFSIGVDMEALDDNKFIVDGYKSVQYKDKKLNSYYYHLVKKIQDYVDDEMIKNAVVAVLKLSIPEYISIDRKDIKTNKALKIVNQKADGRFLGTAYKMKIDNAIDKTNKQRQKELKNNPQRKKYINNKYDKIIETIKASSKWVKYRSKQLLFTTPISQDTIDTLYEQNYIIEKYNAKNLKIREVKDIAKAIKVQLPDKYLTLSFPVYQHLLNQFEINIGEIKKVVDTYYIKSVNQVKSDLSSDMSTGIKNSGTAVVNGLITTLAIMAKVEIDTIAYEDKNYKYVKPDIQSGEFYPTSMFVYDNIGIQEIYKKEFPNFEHALFTIPAGNLFYIDTKNNELGLLNKEKNEIILFDIKTKSKIKTIKKEDAKDFMLAHNSKYYYLSDTEVLKEYKYYNNLVENEAEDKYKNIYLFWVNEYKKEIELRKRNKLPKYIHIIINEGNKGTSHGNGCKWFQSKYIVKKVQLSSNNYIQYYKCSPYMDLFDKDGNFIKRDSAHGGYVMNVKSMDGYIVSQGQYSAKVWSSDAIDFISTKF